MEELPDVGGLQVEAPQPRFESLTSRDDRQLLLRIQTSKRLQSIFQAVFVPEAGASGGQDKLALQRVAEAALAGVQAVRYASVEEFRGEVLALLKKHCAQPPSKAARAVHERLDRTMAHISQLDRDAQAHAPRPLTSERDELFARLHGPTVPSLVPEEVPAAEGPKANVETAAAVFRARREERRRRRYGRGRGSKCPPRRLDYVPAPVDSDASSWCDSSSSDEGGDEEAAAARAAARAARPLPVPDPLVVLQQPPDTFVKVGARDHHFVVEVGLPRSARGRLKRLRTGITLVVELRHEDGEMMEQQPLQLLEDPRLNPGEDRWRVRVRLNIPTCIYGIRKFRLWLDVSPFEQREHGLSVAGILTTAVKVVHKADPKETEGSSATTPTAASHDGKGPRVSTRKRKEIGRAHV